MATGLLSLCEKGKIAIRDGWTGATAHLYLPFYRPQNASYWFNSGQQLTFPGGTLPQDKTIQNSMFGTAKPDTFIKAPQVCISPVSHVA